MRGLRKEESLSWFSAVALAFVAFTPPEVLLLLAVLAVLFLVWIVSLRRAARRTRRQLLAAEGRAQALLQRLPVGVFRADIRGQLLEVNPAAAAILGFPSPEAMLAASAESLYPDPEERQRFVARLQREGRVSAEEVLLRRADGTPVWVLRDAALVREGEREIIEGVLLDWSGPHRAQEQVRLLAHALRSISECVSITDTENRLLFVNEAFLRTYGYSWEELAGQHISVVRLPGEPGPSVEETLAKTLAGGFSGELWNHRKSCQRLLVRLSTSVVRDEAGNPLALIGVARDITEERKKEEALRQAQKMETVGRLASGVAHDFNNLLQAQLALLQLLRSPGPAAAALEEVVGQLESLVHRGASLTKQLLLFSRHQPAHASPLELNAFLRQELDFLRRLLPEPIRLELQLAPEPLVVQGDWHQLGQVLMNLVVNAQDAMPAGGTLTVRSLAQGETVGFAVQDTGTGIPPEHLDKLFEPFFTTKPPGQGTGLGLAVVHGIVQAHGGRVEVASSPGEGSCFTVWLPRSPQGVLAEAQPARVSAPPLAAAEGKTVLLVEDEPLARQALAESLRSVGYRVVEAACGAEALEAVPAEGFHLLLTDYSLPDGSGLELAARLYARTPGFRLVVMSGYALDPSRFGEGVPPGARFLQKPFTLAELAATLANLLRH